MFISPYFRSKTAEDTVDFGRATALNFPDNFNGAKKDYIAEKISLLKGEATAKKICFYREPITADRLGINEADIGGHDEEYAVVFGEQTEIISPTDNGLLLGFAALLMAVDAKETQKGILYSFPKFPMRGYRAFIPGKNTINEFKAVVDMMAYYQHNTLFLEVGGAMEYKKHPEINEKWEEYCKDVRRYSGRSHEIQFRTYRWEKNSIHADNGDGSYLSQDEVRELLAYCRARGITPLPEVPTLCHCDYLVNAHPEIRERMGDEYPDSYCPNHPDTYKLVFDMIDEIIDVFEPPIMHIGHDECYNIGVCQRCENTPAADIYVADITKIHDYLATKGVKTLMWGDKLLCAYEHGRPYEGGGDFPIGGLERWKTYPDGERVRMAPELYPCRDRLPRDIIMMHWYWVFDPELDEVYHNNGYQMVYGNSSIMRTVNWNERSKKSLGAIASNWGSFAPEYMQRNTQTLNLVYNARALAGHDYDGAEEKRSDFVHEAMDEVFMLAHKDKTDYIEVLHTTDIDIPYTYFYDGIFIENDKYLLGEYELIFDDGTTARLPVKYGTNISYCSAEGGKDTIIGNTMSEVDTDIILSMRYCEVAGEAKPMLRDGQLAFLCRYNNPNPAHDVTSFKYIPIKTEAGVTTFSLGRVTLK